jgi:hypothetical protein
VTKPQAVMPIVTTSQKEPITLNVGDLGHTIYSSATSQSGLSSLTYQWYSNNINSNIGGQKLENKTQASILFEPIQEGEFYYYVVVTNSEISGVQATSSSQPVSIIVKDTPLTVNLTRIEGQQGIEIGAELSYNTRSGGAINMQWFVSEYQDGSFAQAVHRAWGNVLRIENGRSKAEMQKTLYYFVIATKTTANSTQTVESRKIQVVVDLPNVAKSNGDVVIVVSSVLATTVVIFALVFFLILKKRRQDFGLYDDMRKIKKGDFHNWG